MNKVQYMNPEPSRLEVAMHCLSGTSSATVDSRAEEAFELADALLAINKTQEEQPQPCGAFGWIPIKSILPEVNQFVLVLVEFSKLAQVGYMGQTKKWFAKPLLQDGSWVPDALVTHWMPIPSKP